MESLSKTIGLTHAHTYNSFPSGDVERSHGAGLSVNLSVVSRSAFSYETPATIILWHFPVSFLPPSVADDQGSATYPIRCVSGSEDRELVCAKFSGISKEPLLWNEGNPSRAQAP